MSIWLAIIITLLLSAFFSGMEIAFVSSNKLKTELDKGKGSLSASILSRFNKNPSKLIGALLLGNNIALVIYGLAASDLLEPFLKAYLAEGLNSDSIVLLIQTLLATLVILVFAEFIPKVIFRINSNSMLNFFALPVTFFYYVFYPFIHFFLGISEFILRSFFNVRLQENQYVFSPIDLDNYVKEFSSENKREEAINQEIQMFQNAMEFRGVKIRECMIPRTEIVAMEENESMELLKKKFIETGLSRILIYNETVDNIIGFVHSYDIFSNPRHIKPILKPIIIVPETMLANKVLTMFIQQHRSVALVVDEFGGTSGMATMEDIIEEIFGEIEDEYDVEELTDKQLNESTFIFSARLEIDYLNEKYKLDLPVSEDYETLAGLIIKHHESIPGLGQEIFFVNFKCVILEASETRIETVKFIVTHPG